MSELLYVVVQLAQFDMSPASFIVFFVDLYAMLQRT